MKKNKLIIGATSLLALAGLVSCGGNSRDIKPGYSVVFANCYSKDASESRGAEADRKVIPDWAFAKGERRRKSVDSLPDGLYFNYVDTYDKANVGTYTIDGNTKFKLGEDVDFSITLDDFVVLNPIDAEDVVLKDPTSDPMNPDNYKIVNPIFFKVYVREDINYNYNELKINQHYTIDDKTPGVYKFHIPGDYVKYSYKVFFSASYVDAEKLGFEGFKTLDYNEYPGREAQTEFEKYVTDNSYKTTNSKVGKALTSIITPENMAAGISFTKEYLEKLEFWGIPEGATAFEQYKNVTNYVNTSLVHYYPDVPTMQSLSGDEDVEVTHRVFPTNQYACKVTFPWINSEHKEGGLFTYKDGKYTLNYTKIAVTVKKTCEKDKIPSYISDTEIGTKFKDVSYDQDTIQSVKSTYSTYTTIDENRVRPALKIEVTAKDKYIPEFASIDVVSKVSPNGDKYFKDFAVRDSSTMQSAIKEGASVVTEDNLMYGFKDIFLYDNQSTNILYVHLPELLKAICFGPSSYCYNPYSPLPTYSAYAPSVGETAENATVTIDMIESIEIGVYGIAPDEPQP